MTQTLITNGMSGLNARNAINNGMTELYGQAKYGAGRPLIGHAGDSIGEMFWDPNVATSPLFWSLNTHPAELRYDPRLGTAGGTNISLSGSSSTSLLLSQLGTLQALAVKPDILFIQTFQNDFINSAALAASFAANATSFMTQALAAGVKACVITGRPPKTESGTDVPRAITELNRILRVFCRDTPGCHYLDFFPLLRDPTFANDNLGSPNTNWRGTSGTANGYATDGTHPSTLSAFAVQQLVSDLNASFGMKKMSSRANDGRIYDRINFPNGNVLGPNGAMVGTGGSLNGSANSGVAGQALGSYPESIQAWTITTNNGIVVTPTIVTGTDGIRRQRLTFSGTTTAQATVTFGMNHFYGLAAGNWNPEAFFEFNTVVGMQGFELVPQGGQSVGGLSTAAVLPTITRNMFVRGRQVNFSGSTNSGSTNFFRINFYFATGTVVSGSVDISSVGLFVE
jgi:hypothetical protein